MQHQKKITLNDIKGDLKIYFNWSANVLMPLHPGAADTYLKEYRNVIIKVAQKLLKQISYAPTPIYRGIILKKPVTAIMPHKSMEYLSFSDDPSVAKYFADINGFGSEILNVAKQLGQYGYFIEYTPRADDVLFHHHFLSFLPYAEAFTLLRMDGQLEVESLKMQKEIVILQPKEPFTCITPMPGNSNHS